MAEKQMLSGGREGQIVKERELVVRPGNAWTPHVQAFLLFMHDRGFDRIPRPYGLRGDGKELVSYVEG